MHTTFIVRLMDAEKALLAWTQILVVARGDGCFYAIDSSMTLMVSKAGKPAWISYHWADMNIEWRVPITSDIVGVGLPVVLRLPTDALVTVGQAPTDLPAVTVGGAVITVPSGRG